MGVLRAVIDNPILIKHVRSRLRLGKALPMAVVFLVLSACITWAGEHYGWFSGATAVSILLGLQTLTLCFGGASQLNSTLGGVRETGLIDFHRVSPLPPSQVALGFFLGAPIHEYMLVAVTLPFAVFSAYHVDAADPWIGLWWLAQLEVAVLTGTWIVHAFTMLGCMTRKKPRGSLIGTIVTIILMLQLSYLGSIGFYFGLRWFLYEQRMMNFFGFMIPWLAWLLIYELPILGFIGLAVARKMGAERAHSYTKPQALAFMATLTLLLSGGLWDIARLLPELPPRDPSPVDLMMLGSVYFLSFAAMILAVTITPDAGEYIKGLRRASRQGRRRLSPWSDAASNRLALFALCAIVVVGATAVVHVVGTPQFPGTVNSSWDNPPLEDGKPALSDEAWLASRRAFLSRPLVIGVLTVAYVGLCLQFFSLRTRTSGLALMTFFLFMVWLVPLLVGAIIGLAGTNPTRDMAVFALSPLPGIALSSGLGKFPGGDTIQLAALAPAITFAFIFNYLLVVTQRKIDRRLRAEAKKSHAGPDAPKTGETVPDGL